MEFSQLMAVQMGWTNYGDPQYTDHVLRYYPMSGAVLGGSTALAYVAAFQVGSTGGQTYWSWYGYNYRVEWCACFVSWCAAQCGYIEAGLMPKFDNCQFGAEWFISRGQWKAPGCEPKAGDIVFFDWNGDVTCDHVGIVERFENGVLYTIEGNTSDKCAAKQYPIGYGGICGYGIIKKLIIE